MRNDKSKKFPELFLKLRPNEKKVFFSIRIELPILSIDKNVPTCAAKHAQGQDPCQNKRTSNYTTVSTF